MAMQYENATALYHETLKKISHNEMNWTAFLRAASHNYRLPFADMVMIYAQRPDATAVLKMEEWNKRYGLWIRPGSKGIAVFDADHTKFARLKYYFDINDTKSTRFYRPVPIWSMKDEYESEVIQTLVEQFNVPDTEITLAGAIMFAVNTIVEDNIGDYLKDLQYSKSDSLLEDLDEQNTAIVYQSVLTSSVAYATLSRCGIHADDYVNDESLRQIAQFNTVDSLNAVGVPTKDMAQMVINEIRKTVLLLVREEMVDRTFAKKQSNTYNKSVKEPAQTERSLEQNENRIYTSGRISDTQHNDETRRTDSLGQIRDDEAKISQGAAPYSVHQLSDNADTEPAFDGNRQNSQSEDRIVDEPDDRTNGSKRAVEGNKSNVVGKEDEPNRNDDTRVNHERTNLQLNSNDMAGNSYEIPAFFTLDEYEELLKYDRFHTHKNKDILSVFEFYDEKEKRVAYLKESFTDTIIETLYQEERLGFQSDKEKNALKVWKGSYRNPDHEAYVSWENVTAFIANMIERNVYLAIPLKPIPTTEEQQLNLFNMEPLKPSQTNVIKAPFTMPQHIIDAVFAEGTENKNDKKKIAVFLSLDRPIDENAEFIKSIYNTGSNGFIMDQRNVAYLWNEDGFQLTWGKGIISSFHKQNLSWNEVAKGIRSLLDTGRYLPQDELEGLHEFEYRQIAEQLWYMCQDMDFDETDHMAGLREYYHGFPDSTAMIAELLKTKEFYDQTMEALYAFNKDYQSNPQFMRNGWRSYAPNKIIPLMERLAIPHLSFHAQEYADIEHNYFITQDTIDTVVSYEHRVNQKYDTYAFFLNNTDKKERIKFLKKEWGEGGSSTHSSNAKGLKVRTGAYTDNEAEILLKWNDVEQRTSTLIAQKKYLKISELQGLEHYEREHIVRDIRHFFLRLPFHNIRPYDMHSEYNHDKYLIHFIKDRSNVEHVLDLMQIALNNTDPTADNYKNMQEYMKHVQEYYEGTYSLFNEKKIPIITTPYEPNTDVKDSIAKLLTSFMEEFDACDFREIYDVSQSDEVMEDTKGQLSDIAGLEDLIKVLNEAIYECEDVELIAKASIIREEVSVLFALQRGSDLSDGEEVRNVYRPYISQEEPRYNTGDFIFLRYNGDTIYGTIELINEDVVSIEIFPDSDSSNLLEISKQEFEKEIIHDYRNQYIYDQEKPFHQIEKLETELQVLSDKDRNTLGYQNFVLLSRIAPLILSNETQAMQFTNANEDTTITISYYQPLDSFKIQEVSNDILKKYRFQLDISNETLNIREIIEDEESETLELINGEVDDHEVEMQMNEFANDYLKDISTRGFYLQELDIMIGAEPNTVSYTSDGEIDVFDGSVRELEYFLEHYADDPIQKISALVPLPSQEKENVHNVNRESIAQKNYDLFKQIAPMIVSGDADYMSFVAGQHDMPLDIEVIEDRIAISHYYNLNGDMMADPDMEFVLDSEKGTLSARTFQQDTMGQYHDVVMNGDVVLDIDMEQELNEYTNKWFQNVMDKSYRLEKIRIYPVNYPVEVEYGTDGHISSFGGTDDDLKWFNERFSDMPEQVSILIPDLEDEDMLIDTSLESTPTEKNITVSTTHVPQNINIASHKLYPEQSEQERHNFKITDFALGAGGLKEKYKANIEAIKLLKQLKQDERLATPDEQEILSHYVGWGALPDAFDDSKSNWRNEYQELKSLLSESEYKAARESTLTAFYTPPIVIEAIYNKLMDMGLTEGNILEPSCGVGNFMGMQPSKIDCNFYGVELDTISGEIAQQLYQKATIAIQGFERTEIPDNLFDAVVGNVPYGQIPVFDSKYNQQHFMIHDYYFAKALDKVKVGGIVVFLTSKFTMDKQNRNVRKYIAQRADLLGAIRLPDNTFKVNAGTEITSDIIILQKREKPLEYEPAWLDVTTNENGIVVNSYFNDHPEMVLGTMVEETSQYGFTTTCKAYEGQDLKYQLIQAMDSIHGTIKADTALYVDEEDHSIPADPTVRNFSFCVVDGSLYYRENSRMYPYTTTKTGENRIRGMIFIRDGMRQLIDYQTDNVSDVLIQEQQEKLHEQYDKFITKYGLLNSRANKLAFQDDSSYSLICSLEVLNEDRTLKRKADIFDKRTIKPRQVITSVKTASEALTVCVAEKGHVDFNFMTRLSGITKETLIDHLRDVIYPNPEQTDETGDFIYHTADEYLSGDVREKLVFAKHAAKQNPQLFEKNVQALKGIQPERIKAGDISVRLGTSWIPIDIYRDFMYQLLDTPSWLKRDISILYVSSTQEWTVTRKNRDKGVKATKTYGTGRINGYKIIENTLNLRDVKIFDTTIDDNGNEVRLLNKKETAIAQDKQDIIKSKFIEWVWSDPERREKLCDIYNEKYNSIRNRSYDGSNLSFAGMNPDVVLRKHQVDAIARVLYGGNTLLAHCVGAGKTFEMIAAGMESKRLGFCSKPVYVVPNNIIGDFASDFYKLYPSANILVATTDTLAKANRHKFFSRISSGDWDGVIITHSQFIKMPVSQERQKANIKKQVVEISNNIQMLREQDGERFTIKQLENMKLKLAVKLEKLNDSSKKDDILCFEQLGIDMMFVDEADLFKNLFIYSKMRNVSGISQTDSQRASDLFMKTQYLDELTNYRGVVFATGTAISNSMSELYTMQRYLQFNILQKYNLEVFDSWASTFGETVTAMELSPEGSGFRMKTRFSKFFNLPELMTMFRLVADIQTADLLRLPVPKALTEVVVAPASEEQREMIVSLGERAEKVRNREVKPYEDNMLKITSDGRKIALEQRLINPLLPENTYSKVNACVNNIYKIWEDSSEFHGTQLVFCDLSTPTTDYKKIIDMVETEDGYVAENDFTNVYEDMKRNLIMKGIPSDQIAFIHDAKNDVQKKDLFAQVRQGNVRVLLGSTSKMGAGTNVQDLIIALHDLDCPWRPRDLEQRRGRGIRQGNMNPEVHVIRYVTEGTFDSYLYQTIEKKQQFISQILTGKTPQRTMEEIDEAVLNYAEIKAIACGDPKIMERCNLEMEVNKLNVLKASYLNQKYELQDSIVKSFPKEIAANTEKIRCMEADSKARDMHPLPITDEFIGMTLDGVLYTDKAEAGNILIELCKKNTTSTPIKIGEYRSFDMNVSFSSLNSEYILSLDREWQHSILVGTDKLGNITKMNNALNSIDKRLEETKQELSSLESQFETAKIEVEKPFGRELELQEKIKSLSKLTMELKLEEKDPAMIDDDELEECNDIEEKTKSRGYER